MFLCIVCAVCVFVLFRIVVFALRPWESAPLCVSLAVLLALTRICSRGMSLSLLMLLSFFMRLLRIDLPMVAVLQEGGKEKGRGV